MKIILTGSLGHIGKPLAQNLIAQGHDITVISSNAERQPHIEALGAQAAIGNIEDTDFLIRAFFGADAVFCMIPPAGFEEPDRVMHYEKVANHYLTAVQETGVKRVVHLSSFGAHLEKGTGIIVGAYRAEKVLDQLDVAVTHIRPTYFYYNLHNFIPMIKNAGMMASNYGASDKVLLVSPADIADAIADEITKPAGQKVRYVCSDERTGNEIAQVLGAAIGKPDLKWTLISDKQMKNNMEMHGMPALLAAGMAEMFASQHSGAMSEDFYLNPPAQMGKVKLEDFAKDFAEIYNQQ
jgi:uncharacterized protein YbjT (DUF2867 family)